MQEVQDLVDAVARNTSVTGSVLDFIAGLNAKLADIEGKLANAGVSAADLAELVSLRDQVNANSDKFAAAISANTPAANAPAPQPVTTADIHAASPAPAPDAAQAPAADVQAAAPVAPAPSAQPDAAPAPADNAAAPAPAASADAPASGSTPAA